MDIDSDRESVEGDLNNIGEAGANWGKAKYDYYYTDYVDKDYPSKISAKEERLAHIEQEEALRIQKKLLTTLDNADLQRVVDNELQDDSTDAYNLIEFLENQNRTLLEAKGDKSNHKRKRVTFNEPVGSDECEFEDEDEEEEEDDDEDDEHKGKKKQSNSSNEDGRQRRPINMAIQKNRGLTPYKKKEYRNPRVKHKLKFKKAMTKRRRIVKEAQSEYHRYSGEATGIKTSTIRSIKLG